MSTDMSKKLLILNYCASESEACSAPVAYLYRRPVHSLPAVCDWDVGVPLGDSQQ